MRGGAAVLNTVNLITWCFSLQGLILVAFRGEYQTTGFNKTLQYSPIFTPEHYDYEEDTFWNRDGFRFIVLCARPSICS